MENTAFRWLKCIGSESFPFGNQKRNDKAFPSSDSSGLGGCHFSIRLPCFVVATRKCGIAFEYNYLNWWKAQAETLLKSGGSTKSLTWVIIVIHYRARPKMNVIWFLNYLPMMLTQIILCFGLLTSPKNCKCCQRNTFFPRTLAFNGQE